MPMPVETVDVVVVGGGLAGVGAALTCAAAGLQTALIERRAVLGWEAAWAGQLGFTGGKSPLTRTVLQTCQQVGAWGSGRVDAPVLEMALNHQVLAAGVLQRNYWHPVQAAVAARLLTGLRCAGKSGQHQLHARVFLDADRLLPLWQIAGWPVVPPQGAARSTLFYNGLAHQPLTQPLALGGEQDLQLIPGIWPGELAIEYTLPQADSLSALLILPELLSNLQRQFPHLKNGILTHASLESFPLAAPPPTPGRHPGFDNLLRVLPGPAPEALNPVGHLLDAGVSAAHRLLEDWPAFSTTPAAPSDWTPLPAPRLHHAEVLVCGGGTAGSLAAIASARRGAHTALLESGTFLGGTGTGSVHTYYWGMPGGLQDEVDARTGQLSQFFMPPGKAYGFHPIAKRLALAQMAQEAGVEMTFQTTVTALQTTSTQPRRIQSVQALSPGGAIKYQPRVVIDSTGDGDIAALAGVPFIQGRAADGLTHPYSLVCGRLGPSGMLTYTNIDSGYVNAADAADLTRARQVALQQYWQEQVTPQNRYLFISPTVGARSSRHIIGQYTLTLADQVEQRQFEDAIACSIGHYDNHAFDYENESDEAVLWVWLMGNWSKEIGSQIPYRCLLPPNVDGLLVACRALSVTYDAHNQLRMQRDMQRIGEAAGLAAALCVENNLTPHSLPIHLLQPQLAASGALQPVRRGEQTVYQSPAPLPQTEPPLPPEQWSQALACEDPGMLLWRIYRAGESALPALQGAVEDENEWTRFWASILLALHNAPNAAAVHTLIQVVSQRKNITRQGYRPLQLWIAALVLLGRTRSSAALEVAGSVLSDASADLHARVAALRALGRIGSPQAVPLIEAVVSQVQLPAYLPMRVDRHPGFGEDPRYHLHLTAAQVLAQLGCPRPHLARPYLNDPRAHVRTWAQRIVEGELNPCQM